MRLLIAMLVSTALLISGCATRSISDSGYQSRYYGGPANSMYQGELSEFDVIGIEADTSVSEEQIANAFADSSERKSLRRGDSIMLIQSGAMIPDADMIQNLEKTFSISAFSGVPQKSKDASASYSRSLRLAAAKGGIGTIVVYWGVLESGIENLGTKTFSWVPIVGSVVPDEAQSMRIRLKVAVVDVRTGRWEVFTPKELDEHSYSARISREHSDQAQVATLKKQAYALAAEGVIARFVK